MKNSVVFFLMSISFQLHSFSIKTVASNIQCRTAHALVQHGNKLQHWIESHSDMIGRALLACVVGGGSYWLWMYHTKNKFDDIVLKRRVVRGFSTEYNGARLLQIEVKSQFDADGGGSASCAYHAINNAERIVGFLTGRIRNLVRALCNVDTINERFGQDGRWRNKIKRIRSNQTGGDWLHSGEIDRLMNRNTNIPSHPYDIIDDVAMLGLRVEPVHADRPWEAVGDSIVPAVQQALRDAQAGGRAYIHQFFINTAHHIQMGQQGKVGGSLGHWFAVVLYQSAQGARTYIIADSCKNLLRVHDACVHKLVDVLESQ